METACPAKFGQTVIVDNRAGAGGVVGQELVLQAPPDGYTMVISAFGPLYVSPLMAGKPSMIPSFAPVGMLSTVPMIVVVPATSRFADWPALLAAAKAQARHHQPWSRRQRHTQPYRHLATAGEREGELQRRALSRLRRGLNDVLASQIDAYVDQLTSSLPHIQSGKLRALVVIGEKRIPELPNVPTLAETGCTPFDGGDPGIFVRTGTPAAGDWRPEHRHGRGAGRAGGEAEAGRTRRRRAAVDTGSLRRRPQDREAGIGDLAKKGLLKPE